MNTPDLHTHPDIINTPPGVTPVARKIYQYLIEHAEQPISYEELGGLLPQGRKPESTVRQHIRTARRIESGNYEIETVGYTDRYVARRITN